MRREWKLFQALEPTTNTTEETDAHICRNTWMKIKDNNMKWDNENKKSLNLLTHAICFHTCVCLRLGISTRACLFFVRHRVLTSSKCAIAMNIIAVFSQYFIRLLVNRMIIWLTVPPLQLRVVSYPSMGLREGRLSPSKIEVTPSPTNKLEPI